MLAAPLLNIEAAFGATALTVPTQTTDPVSYGGSTLYEITSSGGTGGEYVTLDATGLPAGATFDDSLDGCVLEDGSGNASFPIATVNVGTVASRTYSFTVTATEWSDSSCSGTPVSTSSGPVTLDVAASEQTITVPAPHSGPWNASLSVATTASSGLSDANIIDAADSSANGCGVDASGNVSASGPGTCVVFLDQAGDANYAPAPEQSATATFNAAGKSSTTLLFATRSIGIYGEEGQVTFVVVISGHSGDLVPTGTVTFRYGANVLCTTSNFVRAHEHTVVVSCTLSNSQPAVGTYSVTVTTTDRVTATATTTVTTVVVLMGLAPVAVLRE